MNHSRLQFQSRRLPVNRPSLMVKIKACGLSACNVDFWLELVLWIALAIAIILFIVIGIPMRDFFDFFIPTKFLHKEGDYSEEIKEKHARIDVERAEREKTREQSKDE